MSAKKSANERTFQGELFKIIDKIIVADDKINFQNISQEENIGVGKSRFADGLLYSSTDKSKRILFELKNTGWDATDEILVRDAMLKAIEAGIEYFVCGTPRQLVVFKAFEPNTTLFERKKKVYTISNVRQDDEVLLPNYEKTISSTLKLFLTELSDLVHGIKEVNWDSIDKFFVNKLSAYILEASAEMHEPMNKKISGSNEFKNRLKDYLRSQDIFNVTVNFSGNDVYNLCQLANYLLYLKIMFYSYLQREVKSLDLRPLEIPEDRKMLNKVLRSRFDDVLKYDFENIFTENILDEFEFEQRYLPVLKRNVEQIGKLNFKQLNADVIGSIYNTLIDNQEQHNRGQHFTNTNEVDIVNAFCINETTQNIFDSGCGAGTFLVRGYQFLKLYHPKLTHQQLLEKLWGVEIAPFPVFLATMNLCLLDIKEMNNYPVIINSDFNDVESNSSYHLIFKNANKTFKVKSLGKKLSEVKMPVFDACVGNPPYIREKLIENKEGWTKHATIEWGLKKVNQQSDLYVYYLMHTAAFLKEGGRLGYVVSSSWLDVSFGAGLQKFLLEHFKIIAIIDHQNIRSFETALVNTVILILEKCSDEKAREKNNVKFVRVLTDYEKLIGTMDDANRLEKVNEFVGRIEKTKSSTEQKDFQITLINQQQLEKSSTIEGKYENGSWGAKYLRSSKISDKIISDAAKNLLPLHQIADVRYGIKTGANDFFYLQNDTDKAYQMSNEEYLMTFGVAKEKHKSIWQKCGWYYSEMNKRHYIIERFYIEPVVKSQREAINLSVDVNALKFCVLMCNEPKKKLEKHHSKLSQYITDAESNEHKIQDVKSVSGRKLWYDLTKTAVVGDFIFPSKIGERFRLIDNREAKIFCDKVNYVITVKEEYKEYADLIFILLNSILFRYFLDLFSRQMVVKVSDVDVNILEKTLIPNPKLFKKEESKLKEYFNSIATREQGTIYEEVKKVDRKKVEGLIFEIIGLDKNLVDDLFIESCKYVNDRKEKSESLGTGKKKQILTYEETLKLIEERFPEVRSYKQLIKIHASETFSIPSWLPKFNKDQKNGNGNLFNNYYVKFIKDNKAKTVNFGNVQQVVLYEWLYDTFGLTGQKLSMPKDEKPCGILLQELKKDFDKYSGQIKSLLKSNRSKANAISIYRDLLFK